MALKATVFKATLQVSDMDRNIYQTFALTIARHPSETDERMMVRVLAFALNADDALVFTKGLSTDDEPALWLKDLSGEIQLWIEVGQPDEKRLRKACGRARQVHAYSYGGRAADIWWDQVGTRLETLDNLEVTDLPADAVRELAQLVSRTMDLQCAVQEGQVWIGDAKRTVHLELKRRKAA